VFTANEIPNTSELMMMAISTLMIATGTIASEIP